MTELDRLAAALDADPGVSVLVSLVRVAGSAYRGAGARMAVLADGAVVGAISGGCLEKDAVAHADAVRTARRPRTVTFDLIRDDDKPWGLGMGCQARLDVLFEPCPDGAPAWLTALRDAHAARRDAVVATAFDTAAGAPLGARLVLGGTAAHQDRSTPVMRERAARVLADGRTLAADGVLYEFLPPPIRVVACGDGADTAPLASLADALGWLAAVVRKDESLAALDARTAVVLMTHNYQRDLDLLGAALASPAGYVGVLGPRSRTTRLLADLGRPDVEAAGRPRAPVGLDIGAETPEEIALSICAEIRASFAGRAGGPLQARPGPIHER